jgi:hypothetical protein
MRLSTTLKNVILEQTRFDVLVDKFTKPQKTEDGKTKKPLMDFSTLIQIILGDPTTKKPQGFDEEDNSLENLSKLHPGAYTNWLLKNYMKPSFEWEGEINPKDTSYQNAIKEARRLFMEDLYKVTEDLGKFNKYKPYFSVDERDINKYTPLSLSLFVENFKIPEKFQKGEEKKEAKKSREGYNHKGGQIDFEGDDWTVVKISDQGEIGKDAAVYYGGFGSDYYDKGETRWCTASPGLSYFNGYIKNGPLYVIFNNNDTNISGKVGLPVERYQFHFPSNQFMDRADRSINLIDFLNTKAPELKEYFRPEFAKGLTTPGGQRVEIDYPNSSAAKFIALYGFDQFFESIPADITGLNFNNKSNEKIALEVPSSLGRFENLETLMLQNCVKSFPKEIGNLKKLFAFSAPNNPSLTTLPENEILSLPELTFVNVQGSPIKLSDNFKKVFEPAGEGETGFYSKIA